MNDGSMLFMSGHWCVNENEAWAFSSMFNFVCKVDLVNGVIEYVDRIHISGEENEDMFCYIEKWGNKLLLFPDKYDKVAVFDQTKLTWSEIPLGNSSRIGCTDCLIVENTVYIYSAYSGKFFCIDLEKEKLVDTIQISTGEKEMLWDLEIAKGDDIIWTSVRNSPTLYRCALKSKEVKKMRIDSKAGGMRAITYMGDKVVAEDSDGVFYIINDSDMSIEKKIYTLRKTYINEKFTHPYEYIMYINDKLWLIPYDRKELVYINGYNFEIGYINSDICGINNEKQMSINYVRDNNYIGLSSQKSKTLFELDTVGMKIRKVKLEYINRERLITAIVKNRNPVYRETYYFGIEEFIKKCNAEAKYLTKQI